MICNLFSEPAYLFFSSDIPELLYYSHIPATVVALFVGFFVFLNGRKNLLNQLLFTISICFSLWTFLNLVLWTNIHSGTLLFAWSLLRIFSSFISIFSIYFVYVYLEKKDISLSIKIVFLFLLIPVIFFAPTSLNLTGFNITSCDAFEFEGALYNFFKIAFGILAMVWILVISFLKYRVSNQDFRKQILLMAIGMESFLFMFFTINFLAGYLTDIGILPDSSLEFYGLFGMIFFMGMLAYLIVRFKTFSIKLAAAQALIVGIIALVGSQIFFVQTKTNTVLVSITFFFSCLGGYFLVRSVKKEIKQREEIELLAYSLEKANVRLKELDKQKSEFVSIASHQLRSPLTAMRGYASMLVEGSFGKIPEKALEAAKRIDDSAKLMAMSVEDYLNVSRIESGNMKYNLSDFNVRDMADRLCDDLRPEALKQNLILLFRTDLKSRGIVNADVGKTNQIIHNLINNSIKYTPKGTINVFMRDDLKKKRIYIDITDTGIGMSQETIHTLFQKFSRADNANSVNVSGTGLGLYVAFKMAEAMGGTITCKSEGDGKGSTFTFELPLAM
jgi:signal transduction histidine kinase